MYKLIIIFVVVSLLGEGSVAGQFYESGTEPTSLRWRQIQTDHFQVIFPVDAVKQGQHAANVLEYIYYPEGKTLNNRPKKIPVVLHNRPVISNGFVSWAPKRAEWYLTAPQDNYAHKWLEQLAVHEYRHVVQIDKLDQGFTRTLSFLIGQQSIGLVSGLLPKWFLEGDAVATETAMTNAGRGRNPAFEMPLRAIALTNKHHRYDKALFGSYRDHVPNHYEMGYQMVAWSRERYGFNLFDTTIDFVGREPYFFFLYPFKLGLKKETGFVTRRLYNIAFDDLTWRWTKQQDRTGYDSIPAINHRPSDLYTSYRSPQYVNDSTFIALKTGMDQIAQWVEVGKDGKERVVFTPGFINSDRVSYSGNRLVWTETVPDIRWTNRSYSVIKVYDMDRGKERTLKRATRYFSPALSPDGKTVVCVEVLLSGESALVFSDVSTGEEINRIEAPQETLLQTPSWCKDGKSILVITNGRNGKSISRVDISSGLFNNLLSPTYDDISYPADAGTYVFFNGYYNGITNVYAIDTYNGDILQVTSSRFGAFDPQPDLKNDRLLFSDYSVKGYNLTEIELDPANWTPIEEVPDRSLKLFQTLAQQEKFNLQDSIIPEKPFDVKPYRKWKNLIHVHSWAPLYYDINTSDIMSTQFYPGLVLLSQDLLGNLTSSFGYSWRGYHAFHADLSYRGLYPVIDFTIDYGGKKAVLSPSSAEHTINPQTRNTEIGVRTYIPFVFTRNRYRTGLIPQIKLSYNSTYLYSLAKNKYQHGLWEIGYSLSTYRYLKTAIRDLAPPWGFYFQALFQHTPFNTEQLGYIYYLYGRTYTPGLARHHSLQLSGAWQQQKTEYFLFGSVLNFPRGYDNGRTEKLSMGSLDYTFPLAYPDWNWSFIIYIKRLSLNLFSDIGYNQFRVLDTSRQLVWKSDYMFSTGIDITADMIPLQINFPMSAGLRMIYVPEKQELQPHLLFKISFQ